MKSPISDLVKYCVCKKGFGGQRCQVKESKLSEFDILFGNKYFNLAPSFQLPAPKEGSCDACKDKSF